MAIIEVLKKISDTVWEIPVSYKEGMRVPARIYGTEKLIREMDDAVYDQITNVATLPGITKYALCMPDGHFGYGFPIGGVAAMDVESGGVISPGGIGFDINCGMRLMVTNLTYKEVKPYIKKVVDKLYQRVPAGVGSKGFVKLSRNDFRKWSSKGRVGVSVMVMAGKRICLLLKKMAALKGLMLQKLVKRQLIAVLTKSEL
jgi:tRNA-splicing ligase RtcB